MPKRPPMYTFQRPRRRAPQPIPETEMYTVIDDTESVEDQNLRYTRYTFFVVFVMFILLVLAICYTYARGFPVKVRA